MRSTRGPIAALVLALLTVSAAPAGLADQGAAARLESAEAAWRAGKASAVDSELRTAVYSLLDSPPKLARALVYLALAQDSLGKKDDLAATVAWFVDLQRRFDVWSQVTLDPPVRAGFDRVLAKALGSEEAARSVLRLGTAPKGQPRR